jgi:hypothetical protein
MPSTMITAVCGVEKVFTVGVGFPKLARSEDTKRRAVCAVFTVANSTSRMPRKSGSKNSLRE